MVGATFARNTPVVSFIMYQTLSLWLQHRIQGHRFRVSPDEMGWILFQAKRIPQSTLSFIADLIEVGLNEQAVNRLREEAGCFVLISNTPAEGTGSMSARDLLTTYKDQHSVENNFAFLKDPVFVNALFLKSPRRIEALGLV